MKKKEDDPMLSIKEQAELTGMSVFTIYNMISRNVLPWKYYQITPSKRVSRKSDVLAWLDSVCIPARGNKPDKKTKKEVKPVA
jgi:predicted DNA-binding transcriptional regulator AlpA